MFRVYFDRGGMERIVGDGLRDAAGQGAVARVPEKDLVFHHREFVAAQFLIGEDFLNLHNQMIIPQFQPRQTNQCWFRAKNGLANVFGLPIFPSQP